MAQKPLTRDEEIFFSRVAASMVERGEQPTPENIEAAMQRVLERDEELFVAMIAPRDAEAGQALRDALTRAVYEGCKR